MTKDAHNKTTRKHEFVFCFVFLFFFGFFEINGHTIPLQNRTPQEQAGSLPAEGGKKKKDLKIFLALKEYRE